MGELLTVDLYPLTGARPVRQEGPVMVERGGLQGDRQFVLYRDEPSENFTYPRLGQKQYPKLATLNALYTQEGICIGTDAGGDEEQLVLPRSMRHSKTVAVDEFGDATPCLDLGDAVASWFGEFLGVEDVRLAKKQNIWGRGINTSVPPAARANAPLHIVSADSVAAAQSFKEGVEFGAGRFRPNLVIQGFEPFVERGWADRYLRIGSLVARVTRLTERCPVPGYDQTTGVNHKDVPRIYRELPKSPKGKPTFGFYAVPCIGPESARFPHIQAGDTVSIR